MTTYRFNLDDLPDGSDFGRLEVQGVPEDGDTWDDQGIYVGSIDTDADVPTELHVQRGSFFYVYKLDKRERIDSSQNTEQPSNNEKGA